MVNKHHSYEVRTVCFKDAVSLIPSDGPIQMSMYRTDVQQTCPDSMHHPVIIMALLNNSDATACTYKQLPVAMLAGCCKLYCAQEVITCH
jgi:hypothetical protein